MEARARARKVLLSIAAAAALAGGAVDASAALGVPGGSSTSAADPTAAPGAEYVPSELLVRLRGEDERSYELPPGADPLDAAKELQDEDGVAYAAPDYVAHASGRMIPDDPGSSGTPGGWTAEQWNFLSGAGGIATPVAWDRLRDANLAGGSRPGVTEPPTVAVIDTGIAYTFEDPYRRSPDFRQRQFVPGHDFVDDDAIPADENGHGTHIASTIAAQVDDETGFTGIAYGVRLMPLRVLDASGAGTAENIAAAIVWAVMHGADLINLSLEFDAGVASCDQIPGVCGAINRARARRVAVIAAAGNGGVDGVGDPRVTYPGRQAIAVGGTTVRGCLARYSNFGDGLDLVAPGGGRDALLTDSKCNPLDANNPEIVQLSFTPGGGLTSFSPVAEHGTSMASAHVTGVAALVLATRQLNRHSLPPTVGRLEHYLEDTAHPLGDEAHYGAGIVNASSAVRPRRAR